MLLYCGSVNPKFKTGSRYWFLWKSCELRFPEFTDNFGKVSTNLHLKAVQSLSHGDNMEKMAMVQFVWNQCQGNRDVCIHYDVSLPQRIANYFLKLFNMYILHFMFDTIYTTPKMPFQSCLHEYVNHAQYFFVFHLNFVLGSNMTVNLFSDLMFFIICTCICAAATAGRLKKSSRIYDASCNLVSVASLFLFFLKNNFALLIKGNSNKKII